MKHNLYFLLVLILICSGCHHKGKGSIEEADSINKANLDTGLIHNEVVIDEKSSSYSVRIADILRGEIEMADLVKHQGVNNAVKEYASSLQRELNGIHDSLVSLSQRKKIILPQEISADKAAEIKEMEQGRGKQLDKHYIESAIKNQELLITLYRETMTEAKDTDIRSFADISLLLVRKFLNEAKILQKKI